MGGALAAATGSEYGVRSAILDGVTGAICVGAVVRGFQILRHGRQAAQAQRGMRNARTAAAVRRGQGAHASFRQRMAAEGWDTEVRLANGRRADAVRVDHDSKVVEVIELKPRTPTGQQRGAAQINDYVTQLERQYEGYTVRGRVQDYDP
jgi:hypothetical protein